MPPLVVEPDAMQSGAAAAAATEMEVDVMGKDLGERERIVEPHGTLSTAPAQILLGSPLPLLAMVGGVRLAGAAEAAPQA
jgi:hypothetical protein